VGLLIRFRRVRHRAWVRSAIWGLRSGNPQPLGAVSRPRLRCNFCVAMRDLVAVAKKFCDKGRGDLGDEILDGGVTGAYQVNPQGTQPFHYMLCFEVFAGVGARKQPWSTRAATGGAEIRPVMEVLSEYAGERFGHWDRLGPKGNTHLLWREDDGGCLQPAMPTPYWPNSRACGLRAKSTVGRIQPENSWPWLIRRHVNSGSGRALSCI
jgi:hypothetical protein